MRTLFVAITAVAICIFCVVYWLSPRQRWRSYDNRFDRLTDLSTDSQLVGIKVAFVSAEAPEVVILDLVTKSQTSIALNQAVSAQQYLVALPDQINPNAEKRFVSWPRNNAEVTWNLWILDPSSLDAQIVLAGAGRSASVHDLNNLVGKDVVTPIWSSPTERMLRTDRLPNIAPWRWGNQKDLNLFVIETEQSGVWTSEHAMSLPGLFEVVQRGVRISSHVFIIETYRNEITLVDFNAKKIVLLGRGFGTVCIRE